MPDVAVNFIAAEKMKYEAVSSMLLQRTRNIADPRVKTSLQIKQGKFSF